MTATNQIRAAVRLNLVRRLNDKLTPGDDVGQGQCFYQSPTSTQPRNCIFFGDIEGPYEVANLKDGRINRDDKWTQEVYIVGTAPAKLTSAGDSTEAALPAVERAEALFHVIEDLVADHPKLDGEITGLQHIAILNSVDGPSPRFMGNQWAAVYRLELACSARLI